MKHLTGNVQNCLLGAPTRIAWRWFCVGLVILFSSHIAGRSEAAADARAAAIECLALTIYFEARGEPDLGKLAVAHVVLNRSRDARFPRRICDVVRQQGDTPDAGCQFSWTCDELSDRPTDARTWQRSKELARAVYYGRSRDPTAGATFYHANSIEPAWSREMTPPLRIGHQLFYRDGSAQSRTTPVKMVRNDRPIRKLERFSIGELAEQIEQALAPIHGSGLRLTVSFHVYDRDKASRLVRINKSIHHEGDWLGQDLRLLAITPRGITLGRGTSRFDVLVQ